MERRHQGEKTSEAREEKEIQMKMPSKKKGGFKAHPSACGLCDNRGGNAGRLMGKGMPMQEPSYQATEESPAHEKAESPMVERKEKANGYE